MDRGGKLEPEAALLANAHQQLSELIRQNYNHPATAIWSIANEVDFGIPCPPLSSAAAAARDARSDARVGAIAKTGQG
jgi:beta-galactosidase